MKYLIAYLICLGLSIATEILLRRIVKQITGVYERPNTFTIIMNVTPVLNLINVILNICVIFFYDFSSFEHKEDD